MPRDKESDEPRAFTPRGRNGPPMSEEDFHCFIFSLEARGVIARVQPVEWVN